MTMPNFLIVGTPKAGTTALCDYLAQHPQVFMSAVKEPYFFMMEGRSVDFTGPGDREALSHVVTSLDEYQALFADVVDEVAIGEGSTCYLRDEGSAARIRSYVPGAKIIIGLRNPVDRAFSSYSHLRRDGRETIEDFEQALRAEPERIAAGYEPLWHYAQSGMYYESLRRFYDTFPRENIFLYLFEDLNKDAAGLVHSLYDFLGVDSAFTPDLDAKHNVSGIPKNRGLHAVQGFLLQPNNPIKEAVKPLLPERFRKRLLHGVVDRIREVNFEKLQLEPAVRARVLDMFRDDLLRVQDFINRDLSAWLGDKA